MKTMKRAGAMAVAALTVVAVVAAFFRWTAPDSLLAFLSALSFCAWEFS